MKVKCQRSMSLAALVLGALMCGTAVAQPVPAPPPDDLDVTCGPPPPGHYLKGKRDYRARNLNAENQRDFRGHETYHLGPAESALKSGRLQFGVMNNLHFVLHKVPNNEIALRVLIEWDLAGGRDPEYSPPSCYLAWARQFAPDDVVVWNYGAYYFLRKGDDRRADQWWRQTLLIDPSNAEAHYNLGLMALKQGDFGLARTHAWAAYGAGYPLPGLRKSLEEAGQWRDAPTSATATGP